MKGFLLIDKERGCTSFDVVRNVRRILGVKKVGHAGTLDPLATGLLVLAIGEGTKLLEYFIGCGKEYEVLGSFGAISDTFDADGLVEKTEFSGQIGEEELERAINDWFWGEIEQIPPKYSALKIGGRRACDIVRGGGEVEMKSRRVHIDEFEILEGEWPEWRFRVRCSSGTYIRSLINDLGDELGCGAYVKELRRNEVGVFSVKDALKVADLKREGELKVEGEVVMEVKTKAGEGDLLSLEDVIGEFEKMELDEQGFEGLKDGKILPGRQVEGDFAMAMYNGKLVGVLGNASDNSGVKYRKMIF